MTDDESMTVGDIEKNAKRKRTHKGEKQGNKQHKIIANADNQTKNKVGRPPKATPANGRLQKTAIEEIIEF